MPSSSSHWKTRPKPTSTPFWCCSFKPPPKSPDPSTTSKVGPTSPHSSKPGSGPLGRITPRRIVSPGRVSPIPYMSPPHDLVVLEAEMGPSKVETLGEDADVEEGESEYDVRVSLKGKNNVGSVVLEVNSRVLKEESELFGGFIENSKKCGGFWRIEVNEVVDFDVFRETIELMFEDDVGISRILINVGVFRAIEFLEVSASIKFNRGILSCLEYLEAVPWSEEEEEKLRKLLMKFRFDNATNNEVFSRLNLYSTYCPQQNLASQLVRSITTCGNVKARNELKSMVKGLLCESSVYEKDDLDRENLYSVCDCCLSSLVTLFEEAFATVPCERANKTTCKPLIESVSLQVENINWLLEIMLERQMAEEFVDVWANQEHLLVMHENASPMVRYELSRVSAVLFIAMGTGKLQCRSGSRLGLVRSWFGPMLLDFGWLQRCRKGLNVRELEECMGQALLTLALKHQYASFMEWFRCFSMHGTECPDLSKAFQIWWRRSFLRGSESYSVESR